MLSGANTRSAEGGAWRINGSAIRHRLTLPREAVAGRWPSAIAMLTLRTTNEATDAAEQFRSANVVR
jgi:hypothetical protein